MAYLLKNRTFFNNFFQSKTLFLLDNNCKSGLSYSATKAQQSPNKYVQILEDPESGKFKFNIKQSIGIFFRISYCIYNR